MMMMRNGENRARAERSYDVFFSGSFRYQQQKGSTQREKEEAEFERNKEPM